MNTKPRSTFDKTHGLTWFPRMLDKIRLQAAGDLHPDFHDNLGGPKTVDGFCCHFLHIDYAELKTRVLAGGTDEEILDWCFEHGRKVNRIEMMIWNEFVRKFGWNDLATPMVERIKAENGLTDRHDLVTVADLMELDEGRRA